MPSKEAVAKEKEFAQRALAARTAAGGSASFPRRRTRRRF